MKTSNHKPSQAKGLALSVAYINAFRTKARKASSSAPDNWPYENEKKDYSDEGGQYAN